MWISFKRFNITMLEFFGFTHCITHKMNVIMDLNICRDHKLLGGEGFLHLLYMGGNDLTPISKGNVGIRFLSLLQSKSKNPTSFVR
jgi:hypothetical protein